jgi:hypothetical protein
MKRSTLDWSMPMGIYLPYLRWFHTEDAPVLKVSFKCSRKLPYTVNEKLCRKIIYFCIFVKELSEETILQRFFSNNVEQFNNNSIILGIVQNNVLQIWYIYIYGSNNVEQFNNNSIIHRIVQNPAFTIIP